MAFLAYLVLGGLLALRRFVLLWPAIAATAYSIRVTLADRSCPLTTLEQTKLRRSRDVRPPIGRGEGRRLAPAPRRPGVRRGCTGERHC